MKNLLTKDGLKRVTILILLNNIVYRKHVF